MGSTTIKEVHDNIQSLISGASSTDVNINIATMSDEMGMESGIPSCTIVSGGTDLHLDNFEVIGTNAAGNNTGYYRYMKNSASLGDFSNMFFVTNAGTYKFRGFKNSTTIYKNGSSIGTLTTAMSSELSSSLAIGDRIEGNKPFTISHGTYPGLSGAYAGFAGYSFATRVDRQAPIGLLIVSLDAGNTIQLLYTTTGDANVTSLTVDNTWGGVTQYSAITCTLTSTRNYFIYAEKPICCYRYKNSVDSIPIYPLTFEPKFGWYSTNGHILTTNDSTSVRAGSNIDRKIIVGVGNGNTTTEMDENVAPTSVRTDTGVQTNARGGHHCSGNGAKTYSTADPPNLFTCESQGDGSGSEMMPHVASTAMEKFTVMPSTGSWAAFISTGSTIIERYNSSGCLQGTQTFTGNSTQTVYTTKFTGAVSAGDYFSANTACVGYADVNTSQNDERILFMGDSIDAPTCGTGATCNTVELSVDAEGCEPACAGECSTYYTNAESTDSITAGDFIYDNSGCSCEGGSDSYTYYSNKCGGRSGSCYKVLLADCKVYEVTECEG